MVYSCTLIVLVHATVFVVAAQNVLRRPSPLSMCNIEYGTDFAGCRLGSPTTEGSWQECAKRCSQTKGCNYWSWSHKLVASNLALKCYLKSDRCNAQSGPQWLSGNKACASEYQCKPNYGRDYSCLANQGFRRIDGVTKWRDCAEHCAKDTHCKYWSWSHSKSSTQYKDACFMHYSDNCDSVPSSGHVSADRSCFL